MIYKIGQRYKENSRIVEIISINTLPSCAQCIECKLVQDKPIHSDMVGNTNFYHLPWYEYLENQDSPLV